MSATTRSLFCPPIPLLLALGLLTALGPPAQGSPLTDTTPPAAVTTLAYHDVTPTSITLRWTAVGDDGTTGTASTYDLRYRTDGPPTTANWSACTPVSGEPAPHSSGTTEEFTVTGLNQCTTYYFAMKVADEVPNWSGLSNTASHETPPIVANERISFTIAGTTYKIPYYRNKALGTSDTSVRRAVIVIHGTGRNASSYYNTIVSGANAAGAASSTILLAPHFLIQADVTDLHLGSEILYWAEPGWKQGDRSLNPSPAGISSFSVIDSISMRLAANFPNLEQIVFCGHSAGAQFVQRYAAGNLIDGTLTQERGISVRYVVANPGSYMYLDGQRWIPGTAYDFAIPSPLPPGCPTTYNNYKYGLDGIPVGHYMGIPSVADIRENYRLRRVTYLIGELDTSTTDPDLDDGCEANMQGSQRRERGEVFREYLHDFYATNGVAHDWSLVPGVAHDGDGMLNSACGRMALFNYGNCSGLQACRGTVVRADGSGTYANIQAAVNASSNGDCIFLTDGTYTSSINNRNVNFLGKRIILCSVSDDPARCVMDCSQAGRGFIFQNGEIMTTVLRGVTVENGAATGGLGGGILINNAQPTILRCRVTSCTASQGGGASISGTTAAPEFTQCEFSNNTATNDGGGVYNMISGLTAPIFRYCMFSGNQANYGGGMFTSSTTPASPGMTGLSFIYNDATFDGGGLWGGDCSSIVDRAAFLYNNADRNGGGAWFGNNSTPVLYGDFFMFNTAQSGAGYYVSGTSTVTTLNSTIANSTASGPFTKFGPAPPTASAAADRAHASAVFIDAGSYGHFQRSIIAATMTGCGVWSAEPQGATLQCCDIFGNQGGDWIGWIQPQLGTTGNICLDPMFCYPAGGNLNLREGSPCAAFSPQNPACDLVGAFPVGCTLPVDYANHDAGNCVLTVTDRGIVGYMDGTQAAGSGLRFPPGSANHLFIGSLWVGASPTYVANRDYDADPAREWTVSSDPDGHIWTMTDGNSDQDLQAYFDDSGAAQPRGLEVRQESWAFADPPNDDIVIVRYFLRNEGATALAGLYAGLFLDLDMANTAADDRGGVDRGRDLVYLSDTTGTCAGIRLLSGARGEDGDSVGTFARNLTLINNATYVWPNQYILDSDKYAFLSAADPAHVLTSGSTANDYGILASAGPFDLAVGERVEIAFAVLGGTNSADLKANADAAQVRYLYPSGAPNADALPRTTLLLPAAPNPFSERTAVRYGLPRSADVHLAVFDISGRLVRTLVSAMQAPGWHRLDWDGRDGGGRAAGSGVYFLRLQAGGTERMTRVVRLD